MSGPYLRKHQKRVLGALKDAERELQGFASPHHVRAVMHDPKPVKSVAYTLMILQRKGVVRSRKNGDGYEYSSQGIEK